MGAELAAFAGPEHEPFYHAGGPNLAILVHGFPSTPVEMRRLGALIHAHGWSARGILLPGFGPELGHPPERSAEEWRAAVVDAVTAGRSEHDRIVLVGNSMGAALSLQAATLAPVEGLALFAPFWRINSRLLDSVALLFQKTLREIRPFRAANFADPRLREAILHFLPHVDLDDGEIQTAVRDLSLRTSLLGQVRRAGQMGHAALPHVTAPVLIFQGTKDLLAHPSLTRQMARALPNLAGYVEVDSGHGLAHLNLEREVAVAVPLTTFLDQCANRFSAHSPSLQVRHA